MSIIKAIRQNMKVPGNPLKGLADETAAMQRRLQSGELVPWTEVQTMLNHWSSAQQKVQRGMTVVFTAKDRENLIKLNLQMQTAIDMMSHDLQDTDKFILEGGFYKAVAPKDYVEVKA